MIHDRDVHCDSVHMKTRNARRPLRHCAYATTARDLRILNSVAAEIVDWIDMQ